MAGVEAPGDVDFVHDVCAGLPAQVIGELVGIPPADRPQIHHWAERITGSQDAEVAAIDEAQGDDASMEGSIQLAMYAIGLANERRAEPADDLMTLMLATEVDGQPMDDMGIGSFFVQLIVAGNDTSRTMLSSGLQALLAHPDQLDELRADPSLIPGAVEEMLRWASPVYHFRRTATKDVEMYDKTIKAGDKVVVWFASGNRDDRVFDDPYRFDVTRTKVDHVTFGKGGPHFCLGNQLARMEIKIMFEELIPRLSGGIELTGDVKRVRSNFVNGIKKFPVKVS